jgi:hypothetical protein
VTRLGDFSPIGWLIALGSFLKIRQASLVIGLLLYVHRQYKFCNNFAKSCVGLHFGRLKKPSGHPVPGGKCKIKYTLLQRAINISKSKGLNRLFG